MDYEWTPETQQDCSGEVMTNGAPNFMMEANNSCDDFFNQNALEHLDHDSQVNQYFYVPVLM